MQKSFFLVVSVLLSLSLFGQVKPSKEFEQIERIVMPLNLDKQLPEFYMDNIKCSIRGHWIENGGTGISTLYSSQISFFVLDSIKNKWFELKIYGKEPVGNPSQFMKVNLSVKARKEIVTVAWVEIFWKEYLKTEIPKLELKIY